MFKILGLGIAIAYTICVWRGMGELIDTASDDKREDNEMIARSMVVSAILVWIAVVGFIVRG